MSTQLQSTAGVSGWSRFQSITKFIRTVLGWGPLGFAVAIPLVAIVILTVGAIWSVITFHDTIGAASERLVDTLNIFMAASTNFLVLIATIGVVSLGIGTAGLHLAATRLEHREVAQVTS